MEFIVNNLPQICLLAVLFILILFTVNYILHLPSDDQKMALREWLRWAVTVAEKELGSGTGQLKLRQVWDMAIKQFPWITKCLSFDEFSAYVDEALTWMRLQLAQNERILSYVGLTAFKEK